MNTRNSGDKTKVENIYKTAIENLNKIKSNTQNTLSTSIPIKPSGSKPETSEFLFTESGILNNSETLVPSDSDNPEGVTIQVAREFSNIILGNKSNATNSQPVGYAKIRYRSSTVFRIWPEYSYNIFYGRM